MWNKMTVGERLQWLRVHHGLSQAAFGEMVGTSQPSVRNYENGTRQPDSTFIKNVCDKFSVSADWLLFGDSAADKPRATPVASDGEEEPATSQVHKRQHGEIISGEQGGISDVADIAREGVDLGRAGFTTVPLVGSVLSAGGGSFETEGNVLNHFAFRSRWLRHKGRGDTSGMVLMRVSGDSMTPNIDDNDLVLIDQNNKDLRPGRVYAVSIEDMIYLKRVDAEPGKLVLSSFNKEYPPLDVPTGVVEGGIPIIGRAVWWCHDSR